MKSIRLRSETEIQFTQVRLLPGYGPIPPQVLAALRVLHVLKWLGLHHFCFTDSDTLVRDGRGCRRRCGEVAMMGLGR